MAGGSAKTDANSEVFVNSSPVYESIENGSGTKLLAALDYGTPVHKVAGAKKDDIWTEIIFEQNGKPTKGFINEHDIMILDDFDILDKAGFDDVNVREQITERMYRMAIARAIKSLDGKWNLETSDDTDQYANARYVPIRGASPTITGNYEYTKYKTPIQLTGRYHTYNDGMQDLVIYESVDGKIVGSFIGRFTGDSFSGKWENADGTNEMPFDLDK